MNIKYGIKLFIGFYFIAVFLGCAASKPNTPYAGAYPSGFDELANKNKLLTEELGKLPELQDGISEKEAAALGMIVKLYNDYPVAFEAAFNEMYKIGIPEVRKYCSPLQALFWLAEDNTLIDAHITRYSLHRLLYHSWREKIAFTDDQVLQIIRGITDKGWQDLLLQYIQDGVDKYTIDTIFATYKNVPDIFSSSARKILLTISSSDPRWSEIDAILDRLNAPELLDFYINKNIRYAHHIPSYHRPPRSVIKEKYGDCDDLAYLGKKVLTRAGYDVFGRYLNKNQTPNHIGLGIRLEDGSYFLAVDFARYGNHMSGPYKTILELDQALGYGTRYHSRDPFGFDW